MNIKMLASALVLSLCIIGCDRSGAQKPVPQDTAVNLADAQDRSLSADARLSVCEKYFNATKRGDDLVVPLRAFINDKEAWAYTPRLSQLLLKMGASALPLRNDLVKKQDDSPNSQNRRWQDCIDAIRG
jgi:hypothetical protein